MAPRQTTRWLYGMPFWHGIVYRCTIKILKIIGFFVWRVRIKNMHKLPKKEPFLLLGNHSCMLDPFWAGIYVPRGVKSMASAAAINVPYLGKFLQICGCFPKKKYTKDLKSLALVHENYEAGYPILIFPEGNRSWDGRMGNIGPGIGRLIKEMNCNVVYFNLPTASMFLPRWAKYPRWVPIDVIYDGPYVYDESHSVDDIWKEVVEKVSVIPNLDSERTTFGFRMAHGLSEYLWACPSCFSLDSLVVSEKNGNCIECTHCHENWTLTVRNEMIGKETWTVAQAFDRISEHFGDKPVIDSEVFQQKDLALECSNAIIRRRDESSRRMIKLAQGTLEIVSTGIQMRANELGDSGVEVGSILWHVEHEKINAISVEIANLLQFRVDGVVHRIVTPGQSSLLWDFFLRGWQVNKRY